MGRSRSITTTSSSFTMSSQISFIDGQFSLIHIPLSLYTNLLQPILRVLIPQNDVGTFVHSDDEPKQIPDADKHGFLNISITPIECSIVCHSTWAQELFRPAIEKLSKEDQEQISISHDAYEVFSVTSAGMEAGSRVMELTAPLAMAGIPIFFITTYFTDFILVPSKDHMVVVQTLEAKGFAFSYIDSAFVVPSPTTHSGVFNYIRQPPSTPPPSNVADLQLHTFKQLKKRNVIPFVIPGLELVQCSGKEMSDSDYVRLPSNNGHSRHPHWLDGLDAKFYLALVSALTLQPRFLSLTLSKEDQPSLLFDKNYLSIFGDFITGDTEGFMVPIFLDLSSLPLESTGIVCGVAGKLVNDIRHEKLADSELSYLSTARAGAVILSPEGSERALSVLLPLLQESER